MTNVPAESRYVIKCCQITTDMTEPADVLRKPDYTWQNATDTLKHNNVTLVWLARSAAMKMWPSYNISLNKK